MPKETIHKGLDGVYIDTTRICFIDGRKGKLLYRGIPIETLAEQSSFEEVSYLLLYEKLPRPKDLAAFRKRLAEHRTLPPNIQEAMKHFCKGMTPMEALRTTVSALSCGVENPLKVDLSEQRMLGEHLISVFPTIISTYSRIREGKPPVQPDLSLSHAANFLYMLNGERPSREASQALDVDLILHAEHSFNASAFAARVTASTLSDMYSAITSAIATLKGPLHGGAAEEVYKSLDDIQDPASYVEVKLANHEKIMGIGHRVYKTGDPRAKIIRKRAEALGQAQDDLLPFQHLTEIEALMAQKKKLYPNVDFYSALVYRYLGFSPALFTPIFAMARISGWVAHCLEQYSNNMLIRPRAVYDGPKRRPYTPLPKRK